MATTIWRAAGEVLEREELLDGRFQVVLDGETQRDGGRSAVALTLVWLLGREGAVPLAEGYVTVSDADGGELNASLEEGTAEVSAETGAASVRATFIVDAVDDGIEDGAAGDLAEAGARIVCELEVAAEEWRGDLVLGG